MTPPNGRVTRLYELEPGKRKLGRLLGHVRHAPGTLVKAAVIPGSRAVAISAVPAQRRDVSFAAALFLVGPGQPRRPLVERLQHGVRPVATAQSLFVARGEAGREPGAEAAPGTVRHDRLSVAAMDLTTRRLRTLHRGTGQLLMPLDVVGSGLILYRLLDTGADLVSVDIRSGAVRALARLSPLARDFAVDGTSRSIVFTSFSPAGSGGPGRWRVQRLHLDDGRLDVVVSAAAPSLVPHPWPGGGLVYSSPGGSGLTFVGAQGEARWAPLGGGNDAVRAVVCHAGAWWALGLHRTSRPFASLFAYDPVGRRVVTVAGVEGAIDIGGVWHEAAP